MIDSSLNSKSFYKGLSTYFPIEEELENFLKNINDYKSTADMDAARAVAMIYIVFQDKKSNKRMLRKCFDAACIKKGEYQRSEFRIFPHQLLHVFKQFFTETQFKHTFRFPADIQRICKELHLSNRSYVHFEDLQSSIITFGAGSFTKILNAALIISRNYKDDPQILESVMQKFVPGYTLKNINISQNVLLYSVLGYDPDELENCNIAIKEKLVSKDGEKSILKIVSRQKKDVDQDQKIKLKNNDDYLRRNSNRIQQKDFDENIVGKPIVEHDLENCFKPSEKINFFQTKTTV